MKNVFRLVLTGILALTALMGRSPVSNQASTSVSTTGSIIVVSREEGSGTRGAFIELFGIEVKNSNGKKIDTTIETAEITDSTAVMLSKAAQNELTIGYISLGSLNDSVKAFKIDGATATVENVKNGSYKVSRPFNIATTNKVSKVSQDFIDFIMSTNGKAVIEKGGYIAVSNTSFVSKKPAGKIVVTGSSSVTPIMEKLKEAYLLVNLNAIIEVHQSDSTSGMNSLVDNVCDIGMASRELKDSEIKKGLIPIVIATDGLAIIGSLKNTKTELSKEQVKGIYTGTIKNWSEIK